MAAVTYLAGVVMLEAWPVYAYLSARVRDEAAAVSVAPLALGVAGAFALTCAAVAVPLWAGIRRVRDAEI
jgi:hypothetical protein